MLHDFGVSMYEFKSTKSFVKFLNKFDTVFIKVAFFKKEGSYFKYKRKQILLFFNSRNIKIFEKSCIFSIFNDQKNGHQLTLNQTTF